LITVLSVEGNRSLFISEFLQWEKKLIKIIADNSRDLNKAFITIFVVNDDSENLINFEIRILKIQRI
jgi:hypothetical protein